MGSSQLSHLEAYLAAQNLYLSKKIYFLIFFSLFILSLSQHSIAEKNPSIKVIVSTTYLDVHTGPGRGPPIFHVLEKGETITLIKSKTDWIKISLEQENTIVKEGWVHRNNMQYTIGVNGELVDLGIPDREDYAKRRWEAGFSIGEFGGVEALGVNAAFRFTNNLSLEARFSQAIVNRSSRELSSIGLLHQPFPKWRVSPYFTIATGSSKISSNSTEIIPQASDGNYLLVGTGVYYYLYNRLMLRFEYNNYNILPDRNNNININEWRLGLSTFF